MSSISSASAQVMIYLGISICIGGIIGGILNIVVFLSLQTFRQNSCALYLTVMSFVNVGQLITGLFPRILANAFNIDWTQTSLFYRKFRWFYAQLCLLTTFTCLCLATIDQYCTTSSYPRLQQWSNVQLARRLCAIFVLIWLLHGIPYLIYNNHVIDINANQVVCAITNNTFQKYFIYCYVLILTGFLPMIITRVFGFLAYRNMKHVDRQLVPIVRREVDKQLLTVVLVQCTIIFETIHIHDTAVSGISCVNMFVLFILCGASGRLNEYADDYFVFFSLQIPFYIYISASERFRRQLKYVLIDLYLTQCRQRMAVVNEVVPQT